jgi:signal transduction histidine kinase
VDFDFREPDALGVALAVMGGAAVAVRSRHPVAATLVALAAVAPLTHLGYSQSIGGTASLLALYSVAVSRRLRVSLTLLLLTVVVVGVVLLTSPLAPSASDWAANLFVIATAWVFGRSVRVRRAHVATVGARNEAQAEALAAETRAMLVEERARAAREMQDLVAHTLSEVNVQVAAARRTLARGDHASAEQLLRAAEEAGRTAMEETRRAVCVLGHCDDDASLRPQPGLADLDDLLAREKATGTEVGLTSTGDAVTVPPGVALTSYRVVEEALAEGRAEGPRSTAVGVDWRPDSLVVRVRTTPRTPRVRWHGDTPSGSGGLERLRTRVELYGGELHSARTRDGGSEVTARFPTVTGRTA